MPSVGQVSQRCVQGFFTSSFKEYIQLTFFRRSPPPNGQSSTTWASPCPFSACSASGVSYLLGGVLFGVATFRARVLPRWAAGLLVVGTLLPILGSSLVPHPFDRIFAVPVGLALAWLGYALWSERSSEPVSRTLSPQLHATG